MCNYSQGAEIKCMSRLWKEIYRLNMMYNSYEFPEDDPYLYSKFQRGAIVQPPKAGVYQGACTLDVQSEYPSAIMEWMLCKVI